MCRNAYFYFLFSAVYWIGHACFGSSSKNVKQLFKTMKVFVNIDDDWFNYEKIFIVEKNLEMTLMHDFEITLKYACLYRKFHMVLKFITQQ